MPRRLATVMSAMKPRHMPTRYRLSSGKAEVMAATPADTDTATVST